MNGMQISIALTVVAILVTFGLISYEVALSVKELAQSFSIK